MRLWLKVALGVLLVIILLIAGAAAYVSRLDPTAHNAFVNNAVRDATGRELTSDGKVRLRVFPLPSMEAAGVRFSNASWASHPDMARAELVRARIAWLPLLRGRFVMKEFVVIGSEVFLETDAKGRGNWEFKPADEKTEAASAEADSEGLDLSFDSVQIEKARVTYRDGETQKTTVIVMDEFSAQATTPITPVNVRLRASYQNLPVELDGKVGGSRTLLANQPLKPDLEGKLGDAEFTLKGSIEKPLQAQGLKLDIGFQTASTKPLTDLFGLDFEDMGPVTFKGTLLERDGRYDLESVQLSGKGLGAKLDAKGSVASLMEGPRPDLQIKLSAESTTRITELAGVDLGEVGPLTAEAHIRERQGEFDIEAINLSARPRDAHLDLKGSIASVMTAPKPDVEFMLSAKTLSQLYTPLPEVGPVSVSARVEPRGDVVEVHTFKAKAGENDLEGSMTVDVGSKPPSAAAKLQAGLIRLDQLAPPPSASKDESKEQAADGERIFPDAPLPFASLAKVNADINLTAERLVGRHITLDNVKMDLKLENKSLTVKPAFQVADGSVSGQVSVDAGHQPAKIALNFNGKKVKLGTLSREIRGKDLVEGGATDFEIDVNASGDSLRAITAGLNGDLRISIGEARLHNDRLDRIGGDIFMGVLSSLVPTSEQETTTTVRCAVARLSARDGFATADQTMVIETDKVLLKGGGSVDLASEQIDMGANIAPRKGVRVGAGTLSSLVRVQGTLAEPQLATDLKAVVTAGAKVGVALATLGISLVAENMYGELSGDSQPCETALARQFEPRERGSGRDPIIALPGGENAQDDAVTVEKSPEEVVGDTDEEPEKGLKAIGNRIKSLFK